jgi:flagellar biogenesis protein FliO
MSGSVGGLTLFLAASLLVIGLTYGASRMLGSWQAFQTRGRKLRVLEGVAVGKDRSLLLVAVGKEVMVVGASPGGIQMVHQVTDAETVAELLTGAPVEGAPSSAASRTEILEAAVRTQLEKMRGLLNRVGGGQHE